MITFLKDNWWTIAIVLNYILVIIAVATILFISINPTKILTYIIVLLVFPFFGLVVYSCTSYFLAAYTYHKTGEGPLNWKYAFIIAATFVIGGVLGSKMVLQIN